MNSSGKVILAIVGAAAAGAVIGLLMAPEKGSDFRRRIADTTGDWSNQLNQLLAQGKEQLDRLKQNATGESGSTSMTGTGTETTEDRLNKVRERVV